MSDFFIWKLERHLDYFVKDLLKEGNHCSFTAYVMLTDSHMPHSVVDTTKFKIRLQTNIKINKYAKCSESAFIVT